MITTVSIGDPVWFLAEADGQWLTASRGGVSHDLEMPLQLALLRMASLFAEADAPFAVEELAGGRAVLTALRNGDSGTAAVLGWYWENSGADVTDQALYHLAAGFPLQLALAVERESGVKLRQEQERQEREAARQEALYRMANELYTKNSTDEILSEMIIRVKEFYPDTGMDLLMTQDHHSTRVEVKPLRLAQGEDHLCSRAFLEGTVATCKGADLSTFEIAVPISGKQGSYGVLHLYTRSRPFDDADIRILKGLTDAAGSAFENAKLYEQSNVMVGELRLINELTKRLNQSLKLNEIFLFASSELTSIFKADYCCILQLDKSKELFTVQATNVSELMHETFDLNYGYAGIVSDSREPVIVSDYGVHSSVTSRFMQVTGARSLIASPLVVQDEAHGVILVAHRTPGFFSYDNYKLLQVVAGHIGLALANASLHAEVRRMVITDNLTGLYARNYLDEQVGLNQRKDFCGSLVVVDIDHFKSVNDTYGHQVGDAILIQVSRIIRSCIRDTDIAARWGGEELAIYLPQVANDQAFRIAERIRARVEEETEPPVTVSCGISEWNWQDEKISVETLFYRSDMALYRAKHEGRNRVMVG